MSTAVLIPIDRKSVRRHVPVRFMPSGLVNEIRDAAGNVIGFEREVIDCHSIFDDRPFDFGYLPVEVQCESCGSRFPHDQLQSDCFKDADGDERCSFDVCPICQHRDCCDVEYETLPFIEMSRLASENEKPG